MFLDQLDNLTNLRQRERGLSVLLIEPGWAYATYIYIIFTCPHHHFVTYGFKYAYAFMNGGAVKKLIQKA